MIKIRPRNDYVLVKVVQLDEVNGLIMPDASIEGKEFHVVEVGPAVKDLWPGDRVLMIGNQGVSFYPLPGKKDLLVIKQEHVVLVFGEGKSSQSIYSKHERSEE